MTLDAASGPELRASSTKDEVGFPRELAARFAFAAGSVLGRDHARARRNNQDAVAIEVSADRWALVVADGCGSGRGSEVGARLGSAFVASYFASRGLSDGFSAFQAALVSYLDHVATAFGPEPKRAQGIVEHLLFTFLVALVEPERTRVFGVGDGLVIHGASRAQLSAGPHNTPSYAAYDLVPPESLLGENQGPWSRPVVHLDVETSSVSVVGVATDGALALSGEGSDPISMIYDCARRSQNPYVVQRRLTALAERGPRMADDTSLALVWRKSCT